MMLNQEMTNRQLNLFVFQHSEKIEMFVVFAYCAKLFTVR